MQAVEREDFELAALLKQEEQSLRRQMEEQNIRQQEFPQERSWASVATVHDRSSRSRLPAGDQPSASQRAVSTDASGVAPTGARRVATGGSSSSRGGLVFFLPAPGDLSPETFKPTSTHVSRRDALARIASAALWRGRGVAWQDVKEVVFLFEDDRLLRISPRFVSSCPVPSEYHLVMVLGRALDKDRGALGLRVVQGEYGKPQGGHIEDIVAEYASAGPTAAVLLHESYPNGLGIYDSGGQGAAAGEEAAAKDGTVIFFLGAVRDMSADETKSVQRACRGFKVPLVEANLGQQAEFTSKIIDVLQGHHLHGRLTAAVWRRTRAAFVSAPAASNPVEKGGRQTKATFWVFVPIGGSPRDLAADDRKKDGMYEVPRCCIAQLWCSKGEHSGHVLSFVFAGGEVLTVSPSLVTCLKLQHRAAPTERNLVNALRVGFGDHHADPTLTVDDGCVTLGDIESLRRSGRTLDRNSTAFVDLQLDSGASLTPRLDAYAPPKASSGSAPPPRDVVLLVRQADGRDFPRGFREKLINVLLGEDKTKDGIVGSAAARRHSLRWLHLSLPQMSSHGVISLLAHYWHTRALQPALASKMPALVAGPEGEPRRSSSQAERVAQPSSAGSRQPASPTSERPRPAAGAVTVVATRGDRRSPPPPASQALAREKERVAPSRSAAALGEAANSGGAGTASVGRRDRRSPPPPPPFPPSHVRRRLEGSTAAAAAAAEDQSPSSRPEGTKTMTEFLAKERKEVERRPSPQQQRGRQESPPRVAEVGRGPSPGGPSPKQRPKPPLRKQSESEVPDNWEDESE